MNEANKKTPRTFQCRNSLWNTFEEMAQELECSVDYLINDAMKQYARQRGYAKDLPSAAMSLAPQAPVPHAPMPSRAPPAPSLTNTPTRAPAQQPGGFAPLPGNATLPYSPPAQTAGSGSFPHPAAPAGPPPLPPGMRSATGPTHSAAQGVPPRPPAPPGQRAGTLTLHFEGNAFLVSKDRFIIGRGKANSDLTIRDPNVSRQHAVVEFTAGVYYIVDLGSTNGIEFRGQRVQRKAIQNGDVFRICDHDVFCSLA